MKVIKLNTPKQKIINQTALVLNNGGLVIYPTETCYGIGAKATNRLAVSKLLAFKGNRKKAISIAVSSDQMARQYVDINETADNLYQNFLPGPLTIISASKGKVIPILEAGTETLGIRIPDYPLITEIIRTLGCPITATSANTTGKKTPYCLEDIIKYTSKTKLSLIDLIIDAGPLPAHACSTVVDTTLNATKILRQGEITIPDIPGQTYTSSSEKETQTIAESILNRYKHQLSGQSILFALQGELGSGKTQLAKGFARALKIKANVNSPTYTIVKEYPFCLGTKGGIFFHLDTWRLTDGKEILNLGFAKMLQPGNVIAIEWSQKAKEIINQLEQQNGTKIIWIEIKTISVHKRTIRYQ